MLRYVNLRFELVGMSIDKVGIVLVGRANEESGTLTWIVTLRDSKHIIRIRASQGPFSHSFCSKRTISSVVLPSIVKQVDICDLHIEAYIHRKYEDDRSKFTQNRMKPRFRLVFSIRRIFRERLG